MNAFTGAMPDVAGTIPQWGMLGALLVILAKQIIPFRQQNIDRDSLWCKTLTDEVASLKAELKANEIACTAKNKALEEELHGMRRQHIQEQISLINTIMRSVDAPQLKGMIDLLERVQQNLVVKDHQQEEHNHGAKST